MAVKRSMCRCAITHSDGIFKSVADSTDWLTLYSIEFYVCIILQIRVILGCLNCIEN